MEKLVPRRFQSLLTTDAKVKKRRRQDKEKKGNKSKKISKMNRKKGSDHPIPLDNTLKHGDSLSEIL